RATLSSAVKSGNSEVIWNERARPYWLRRQVGSAVMSRPSKRTCPALDGSSPASWAISVVLPAPFGPMMACNSPFGTSSETAREGTPPPKRLVKPATCSSGSATALPREQSVDAATGIEHDQQKQRSEDELPVFGHPRCRVAAGERQHGRSDHD